MSDNPWIKWYAGDFLNGIAELGPHEIAVYTVVLNRIYDEGGPIPDDPQKIARRCNMRLPQCEKALASLAKDEKLIREDGIIANRRARKELGKRQERNTKQASNVNKRWQKEREKPKKNNTGDIPPYSEPDTKPIPTRSQKPESDSVPNGTADMPPSDDVGIKVWAWKQGADWIADHDAVKPETVKTFLGKQCRDFGGLEVARALAEVWGEARASPGTFVQIRPILIARLKNGIPTETQPQRSTDRIAGAREILRKRDQENLQGGP